MSCVTFYSQVAKLFDRPSYAECGNCKQPAFHGLVVDRIAGYIVYNGNFNNSSLNNF